MEKWINKVAVVTGASCGIGKDISLKLISHGLKVVGCGRNMDNLLKVNSEIPKGAKGQFIPFQCDVSKEEDVLNMFSFVKTNFKELSILINNAGFAVEGSILYGKTEDLKSMFDTNVLGICMCTREAFTMIRENEKSKDSHHAVPGYIININSIAGHIVVPIAFLHFYTATKFAVSAITEGTRQELREAKSDIRVTQICPGYVETEFADRAFGEGGLKRCLEINPEMLQPSDISEAIIFALSAPPRSNVHDIIIRPTAQTL